MAQSFYVALSFFNDNWSSLRTCSYVERALGRSRNPRRAAFERGGLEIAWLSAEPADHVFRYPLPQKAADLFRGWRSANRWTSAITPELPIDASRTQDAGTGLAELAVEHLFPRDEGEFTALFD